MITTQVQSYSDGFDTVTGTHPPKKQYIRNTQIITYLVLALLYLGIVMVFSSSFIKAEYGRYTDNQGYFFFKKQLLWVIISIIAMFLVSRIPYQFWAKISYIILAIMVLLLIGVFIPGIGRESGGAHRWIRIGSLGFQPSEFAKLALIIFVSYWVSKNHQKLASFKSGFVPVWVVIGLIIGLILIEPDIGTAALLVLISSIMLVIGGIRLIHMALVLVMGLLVLGVIIYKYPHVRTRLSVFANPIADIQGKSYQINQALIALGAGGWSGVGLGASKQKLFFLPQQHTDFIFVIIGEELGFLGAFMVIILFLGLLWCGRRIMLQAQDTFGVMLAFGLTLLISLQALINIAVVTALLPTKGLALPFISYGGSALLSMATGVGILLNIARQSEG